MAVGSEISPRAHSAHGPVWWARHEDHQRIIAQHQETQHLEPADTHNHRRHQCASTLQILPSGHLTETMTCSGQWRSLSAGAGRCRSLGSGRADRERPQSKPWSPDWTAEHTHTHTHTHTQRHRTEIRDTTQMLLAHLYSSVLALF